VLGGGIAGYPLASEELLDKYLPLTAAPEHHRAMIENDAVRVPDVRIAPGDTAQLTSTTPRAFSSLSPRLTLCFATSPVRP
jgi:hypothetical protein